MGLSKWTPTTHLKSLRRFGKLGEELGECSAVASRCIIQGIDEVDPASGKTNRQRLTEEIADVLAQIDYTVQTLKLDSKAIADRWADKISQMREWESMFPDAESSPETKPEGGAS